MHLFNCFLMVFIQPRIQYLFRRCPKVSLAPPWSVCLWACSINSSDNLWLLGKIIGCFCELLKLACSSLPPTLRMPWVSNIGHKFKSLLVARTFLYFCMCAISSPNDLFCTILMIVYSANRSSSVVSWVVRLAFVASRELFMNRSIQLTVLVTRVIELCFCKRVSISDIWLVCVAQLCSRLLSSSLVSKLSGLVMLLFWSQAGPFHHSVWFLRSAGKTPLLAQSAGFSCDLTCLHALDGVICVIFATLLATKLFQRVTSPCNHPSTTIESVQQ